jgi:hypothetical protein
MHRRRRASAQAAEVRLIAKSFIYHRACAFEIKIKDFEAKGFFRSKVIGKRPLRHFRSLDYVANARAREPALMHRVLSAREAENDRSRYAKIHCRFLLRALVVGTSWVSMDTPSLWRFSKGLPKAMYVRIIAV